MAWNVLFQMDQARLYHDKLVNIKKTMLIVQEKTASLKVGTTTCMALAGLVYGQYACLPDSCFS